jgi:hypothetical protein
MLLENAVLQKEGPITMRLHLGVLDLLYENGGKSTGDVAQLLENRYHILEIFAEEAGGDVISKVFEHSAQDAIEDLIGGAPVSVISLTLAGEEEIATATRIFIDQRELDGVVPGVPTKAARKGVNHRLKHPTSRNNPERPSFRDTGTYQAALRAWTTED